MCKHPSQKTLSTTHCRNFGCKHFTEHNFRKVEDVSFNAAGQAQLFRMLFEEHRRATHDNVQLFLKAAAYTGIFLVAQALFRNKVFCCGLRIAFPGHVIQVAFFLVQNVVGNRQRLHIRQSIAIIEIKMSEASCTCIIFKQPFRQAISQCR